MEKELELFMNGLTPSEAEAFDASFTAFGGDDVSSETQERILSSVMRKAGADMKEKNIVKKKGKNKKRIIMMIAAAVLMSLGAVGAGAYHAGYRLEDGQIIRKFGGEGAEEWLDSRGLNEKQNAVNGHFDISMYSFISDGNICQAYWCIEALDETAKEQMDFIVPAYVDVYYADTGEKITVGGSGVHDEADSDETHYYFTNSIPLTEIDTSRDIEFRIVGGNAFVDRKQENLADDLRFVVDPGPNVETKTLVNENGTELLLSPMGITQRYSPGDEHLRVIKDWELIKSDGSTEKLPGDWGSGTYENEDMTDMMFHMDFSLLLDISDIDGVKIYVDILDENGFQSKEYTFLDVNK